MTKTILTVFRQCELAYFERNLTDH